MMPTPTHLVDCVAPIEEESDDQTLVASVHCSCGSSQFALLFPGQTHEYDDKKIPCTAEVNGRFFFLIEAECSSCGKHHLLLDKDFHGWDGFVCHDVEQSSLPRPDLVSWMCQSCSGVEHEATVKIQTEGKEDFVEQTDGAFEAECWPDGFGWFGMSIRCTSCSVKTPDWISYETM